MVPYRLVSSKVWLSATSVSFVMVELSKMTLLVVFRMCTSVPYTSEEWSMPAGFFLAHAYK